jgi:hypothetical protein
MSKSFEPRFLCSKIHSSPHSCISKFYAIFWDFSQIFLPPESLYSISNPILIHKSIRIDFLLLYLISAQEIVSAWPPPYFPAQLRPTSSLPFSAHPAQQTTSALAPSKFTSSLREDSTKVFRFLFMKVSCPQNTFSPGEHTNSANHFCCLLPWDSSSNKK